MSHLQSLHQVLDQAAELHPTGVAVSHGEAELRFGVLRAHSERLASWLVSNGVRRGDRVVIALPPDVIVPGLIFACSRMGAVFVVLHDSTTRPVGDHVMSDSSPVLVITDQRPLAAAAAALSIAVCGSAAVRAAADEPSVAAANHRSRGEDPLCLIYTSGSTAMPKAVICAQQQVTFCIRAIQSQLNYRPRDVVWSALPMSFDYGLYQLFLCVAAGARLHLADPGATGASLLLDLRRTRTTVLPAVPTLAGNLIALLARRSAFLPGLRLLTSTGAVMPDTVLAELRRHLPQLQVQLMYGLTECKRATIMPPDEDLRRPGSSGRALPGTEVFTVGADESRLGPGEEGQIVVRGPNVMLGYWRHPESTARRFRRLDEQATALFTGDFGWLSEDGYLYFTGRRDDIYKERGTRVSAVEVAAAADGVTGVTAATVLPPSTTGDEATLFVVSRLSAAEVLCRLRHRLDAAKMPPRCVVVHELPRTSNGKIDRGVLHDLAE